MLTAKSHAQATQDIRTQCEWLLHKEFIANTPYERLQHIPRYLKAISLRLDKLRADTARDARLLAQIQPLQQAWQRKSGSRKDHQDPRIEEFGWLLQELRVSLFAQELKTPVIVSVKGWKNSGPPYHPEPCLPSGKGCSEKKTGKPVRVGYNFHDSGNRKFPVREFPGFALLRWQKAGTYP